MNVSYIPVRGGSKSIPLKNIRPICGKPLVYWVTKAACECKFIDKVYIATDSNIIKEAIEAFKKDQKDSSFSKIEVIGRSAESATDTASTEYGMLEFARQYEFDTIVLIQATSPLLSSNDLDKGFEAFFQPQTDSVLSTVRQKRFHWQNDESGFVHPTNYDVYHRPRRQEFDGYLVENGAFYITSKQRLLESQNRVSGNIKAVEMNEDTFFEIDEPSDWVIIEALMKKNGIEAPEVIPQIKMFLTDCDGCLTDGGMYYSEKGDELKKFNTRDGMAIRMLKDRGIVTGIITSEKVELNRRRAQKMKMDILEDGCVDKLLTVKKLSREYNIPKENICYIGDDVNDIDILRYVGFSCCPADASQKVIENVCYVARTKGGAGVIREVTEMIIHGMQK